MNRILLFQKSFDDPMFNRWEDCVVPSEVTTIRQLKNQLVVHRLTGDYRVFAENEECSILHEFAVEAVEDIIVSSHDDGDDDEGLDPD